MDSRIWTVRLRKIGADGQPQGGEFDVHVDAGSDPVDWETAVQIAEGKAGAAELFLAGGGLELIGARPLPDFRPGDYVVHRHSSPEAVGDVVLEISTVAGMLLRDSQTGEDFWVEQADLADWFRADDPARFSGGVA